MKRVAVLLQFVSRFLVGPFSLFGLSLVGHVVVYGGRQAAPFGTGRAARTNANHWPSSSLARNNPSTPRNRTEPDEPG